MSVGIMIAERTVVLTTWKQEYHLYWAHHCLRDMPSVLRISEEWMRHEIQYPKDEDFVYSTGSCANFISSFVTSPPFYFTAAAFSHSRRIPILNIYGISIMGNIRLNGGKYFQDLSEMLWNETPQKVNTRNKLNI